MSKLFLITWFLAGVLVLFALSPNTTQVERVANFNGAQVSQLAVLEAEGY